MGEFLQLDLTFDDQTRHYTNLTENFSLFGNRIIHLCGKDFIGYIQDVSEENERNCIE